MKSFRRTALCLALVAGLSIAIPPSASADVGTGGFESPVVPAGTFVRLGVGQHLGAWTVTAGDVDLSGTGFWQVAEGHQSLDLDGSATRGAVSQSFDTVPLFAYQVTFALAGNPVAGPAVKTVRVLANGDAVADFSFDVTGKSMTNMGYLTKRATFLATGFTTNLTFASTTGSGYGPVIDKVRVESCLLVICL
jgi:choice-of-anchor C domain-containing protein